MDSHPLHNRRKRWYDKLTGPMGRLAKWGLAVVLLGLVAVIAVASFYGWRASRFDMSLIPGKSLATRVLSDDYKTNMGSPYNREGIVISYDQLPPHFIQALMAREDESFESHNGVDTGALMRSALRNTRDLAYTQGGSTITMQLARNVFDLGGRKSLDRKVLEMAVAMRMERNYTKKQILEAYLNRIYFGAGAYGVGDAARTFFGKTVSELSVGESALLVGIIRAPSRFNPFSDEKAALQQRNDTLDRMADSGYLSREQADMYKKEILHFARNDSNAQASFPLQWVKREIDDSLSSDRDGAGSGEGEEESGLTLFTSFNLPLQRHIEQTTELALQKLEAGPGWKLPKMGENSASSLQAAVLVLKPNTGNILAMIGGRDSLEGKNLWMDMERKMGDLFSPLIYVAVSNASRFIVSGRAYESARNIEEKSIVELARKIGIEGKLPGGKDLAEGIFDQPLERGVALTLVLHNGGYLPRLHAVISAETPSGKVLWSANEERFRTRDPVFPPDATRIVYKMAPFRYNSIQKVTSIQCALPENGGFFSARIHDKAAVFVWLGQEVPTKEEYEKDAFRSLLSKTSNSLSLDLLSYIVPLPREEVKPPETPAPKKDEPKKKSSSRTPKKPTAGKPARTR